MNWEELNLERELIENQFKTLFTQIHVSYALNRGQI